MWKTVIAICLLVWVVNADVVSDYIRAGTGRVESSSATPIEKLDLAAVLQLRRLGGLTLVDSRDDVHFRRGHLPGAVPLRDLHDAASSAARAPRSSRNIVVYCDSGSCSAAMAGAIDLSRRGYRGLAVYRGGIEEWTAVGMDLERSTP